MIRYDKDPSERRPARQRLSRSQRRDLVFDAATEAFAEHGYQGASIGQIASHAGVVASVVYDHFRSKRELYLQLLTHHGQALLEHTANPHPSASPAELFDANIEAFYQFVEANPFVWRMIFRDPPADADIAAEHDDIQHRASEGIAELVASIRPDEPLLAGLERTQANIMLAEGIKQLNNGLASWWYDHQEIPRQQVVAIARTLLWTGLEHLADTSDKHM